MKMKCGIWLSKSTLAMIIVFNFCLGLVPGNHLKAIVSVDKKEMVRGLSVSNCVVTGVARVVKTYADCAAVQTGDIIVAVMTNKEWLPALERCAGIITDLGGDYCHALLYGKKRGIPVIVGTGNATEKICSGETIALDCTAHPHAYVYDANNKPSFVQPTTTHGCSSCRAVRNAVEVHEHYNCVQHSSYHHISNSPQEPLAQKKDTKNYFITQDVFNRHCPGYIADIVSTKNKYWWGKKTGTIEMGAAAKGFDPFSIKCIPVADDFFDLSEKEIRAIVQILPTKYLSYINSLIEKCKSKANDKNWISRIVHEEHVKTITLSDDIKREELIADPSKYKTIIDQKRVDTRERHILIAAGLFARYWYENNCQVQ